MADIKREYPGKNATEIFTKVHDVMDGIAKKMEMTYQSDPAAKTGKVSKMGITGAYTVRDGEVSIDLKFPMLIPGAMKKKVQEMIESKLANLFA